MSNCVKKEFKTNFKTEVSGFLKSIDEDEIIIIDKDGHEVGLSLKDLIEEFVDNDIKLTITTATLQKII